MAPLRVMVVDDNPAMLRSLARLLESIPDVEVVCRSTSGLDALEASARLRPHLVLLDLAMPGMDGLETTRRLVASSEATTVIIVTVHDLPEYRTAALAAGAHDFLIKSELGRRLVPIIRLLQSRRSDDDTRPSSPGEREAPDARNSLLNRPVPLDRRSDA